MTRPAALRCAIYTRKSSEEGLDQAFNSLDAQREACAAYVLSQAGEGWTALPALYDDGGFSGGNMERPALKRLLADIDRGGVDVVVVYKVDRLTRSLGDFGRIVERFDGRGVSFVSVTQAFNTTTSMGRLTLNVLLSFAQFEREVTGERIRDKIAASKAKGLWMGGATPLGYDPDGRTLKINPEEAELVRRIFRRYLELGSVHRLREELEAQGVRSRLRVTASGKTRGGVPLGRGALFHLLSNRTYLGQVPHKEVFHPGLHPPLLDAELFEAVRVQLTANAGSRRRKAAGLEPLGPAAPLAGVLTDEHGRPMSPVSARGKSGQVYRYYVSSPAQVERDGRPARRVSAPGLEQLVLARSREVGVRLDEADPWAGLRVAITSVALGPQALTITYQRAQLSQGEQTDQPTGGELVFETDRAILTGPALPKNPSGPRILATPAGVATATKVERNCSLMRALARAEAWRWMLVRGEAVTLATIAQQECLARNYVQRILRLAFLAPDLKLAILEGCQPAGLTLDRFMRRDLPLAWIAQRSLFATAA